MHADPAIKHRRIAGQTLAISIWQSHQMESIEYVAFRRADSLLAPKATLTVWDAERPVTEPVIDKLRFAGVDAARWPKAGHPFSDVSTIYLCAACIEGIKWIGRTRVDVRVYGLYKDQARWHDEAMEYSGVLHVGYVRGHWKFLGMTHRWAQDNAE